MSLLQVDNLVLDEYTEQARSIVLSIMQVLSENSHQDLVNIINNPFPFFGRNIIIRVLHNIKIIWSTNYKPLNISRLTLPEVHLNGRNGSVVSVTHNNKFVTFVSEDPNLFDMILQFINNTRVFYNLFDIAFSQSFHS